MTLRFIKKALLITSIIIPSILFIPLQASAGDFGCIYTRAGCTPDFATATCDPATEQVDFTYCLAFSGSDTDCAAAPRISCLTVGQCGPPNHCSIVCSHGCPNGGSSTGQKCPNVGEVCCSSPGSPFCGGNPAEGVSTALGCLKTGSIRDFTNQILAWAAGLGAGIAFLIIVYGGFQIATAAGDPKRVKGGQELIATALGALALIVLAVVALNFVGVRILDLSGLGFNV